MKKRILSILLALALLCAILPATSLRASAETTSGTCGDNLTWSYDSATGTLTIQGSGKMDDFDDYAAPWDELLYSIKKITIGNGVTSIGESAFSWCTSLTSVTIPSSVTSIGDYAFYGCASLTSVTIPNSVTSIGDCAFRECTSLTSVTIPNSVTSIGEWAFGFCNSLKSVSIPKSVTSIGDGPFAGCESLTKITVASGNPNYSNDSSGVLFNKNKTELIQYPAGLSGSYTIPNSVTSIGDSAFESCAFLTSVTIPNSVTSIGVSAFAASPLTSVTIPNSVTSIGESAFSWCTSLTSVTIPSSVTSIGDYAFWECTSLTSVTIPDSVTSIGGNAFDSCKALTSVTIGSSVTSIGSYAFYYCESLTSVTIPDSVTSIGKYAFCGCTSLTSVTIPDSVTSIGSYAFCECDSLTKITVASGNPNYCSDSHGVLFNKDKTKLIQCPGGLKGSYTIPDSVTSIGYSAFESCDSLTSVTIGSSVTSIGSYAFSSCGSLTSVTIPNSVTSIGGYAFEDCTSLTSVTIPSSVTSIGWDAFAGCSSLTSVTIPNSVTSIGEGSFSRCSSMTKINVASGNPNYCSDSHGVLFNKSKTELIQCPGGFQGSYTIPSSVTGIGYSAFESCASLTSVTIPSSVTSIGDYAFESCASLTSVTIPNSVTSIGNYAFAGCSSLTSVTIPSSVTSIGDGAFVLCSEDLVIYGAAGSTAETYATNNKIPFVAVAVPTITTQPKSATVAIGQSVTFQVAATGGALSYQWQFKKSGATSWSNWAGHTEATLTVTGSSTNNGCKYRCVVSNPLGKKNSNYATLTVSAASVPVITTQPKAQTTTKGKTVTFKVVASGSGLSYQWQYSKDNGASWTNWSGKTAASLSVTGSATNNGCLYRCVVKNAAGSVTSSSARLTVSDVAPVILTQPKAQTTTKGKTVTFKVVAGGSGLSYQWQYSKNNGASWTNWSGKTAASLSVTGSATNSGCLYRCVVKNSHGTVTSSSARLTVSDVAPVILTQPANASASVGKTATFKVVAAGSGLSYQWQYKKAGATSWTNWSGKTSATLTVTASSTNGGCRYRCVVKNSYGTVTSSAATLTVK